MAETSESDSSDKKTSKQTDKAVSDAKKESEKTSQESTPRIVTHSRPKKPKTDSTHSFIFFLIIIVGVLFGLLIRAYQSDNYVDATAGYRVKLPRGWQRIDTEEGALSVVQGDALDPNASIYVYGQRFATTGFYETPEDEKTAIFDPIIEQINGGTDQFILPSIGLSGATYKAERKQHTGTSSETIDIAIEGASGADGQKLRGRHLVVIGRNGGIYNIVALADDDKWDRFAPRVQQFINDFSLPGVEVLNDANEESSEPEEASDGAREVEVVPVEEVTP